MTLTFNKHGQKGRRSNAKTELSVDFASFAGQVCFHVWETDGNGKKITHTFYADPEFLRAVVTAKAEYDARQKWLASQEADGRRRLLDMNLVGWRFAEAAARNVPTHKVFPDRRLYDLARTMPDVPAAAWEYIAGRPVKRSAQ